MSAVTAEFLQTAWKGLDAHHLARVLRRFVHGTDYMGSPKSLIIEDLLRGERCLTQEQALRVASLAGEEQRTAAARRNTKRAQEQKQRQITEWLRDMRRQAYDIRQAVILTRGYISLDAEYLHVQERFMFTVSMHHKRFHEKLPALHEALPGFIFSAIPAQLVTIYVTEEQLNTAIDLFVEPWSRTCPT